MKVLAALGFTLMIDALAAFTFTMKPGKVKEFFNDLDTNKDGYHERQELYDHFNTLDTHRDGNLTLMDIPAAVRDSLETRAIFKFYDKLDNVTDGIMPRYVVDKVFDKMDADGDGRVSFEEFTPGLQEIRTGVQQEIDALENMPRKFSTKKIPKKYQSPLWQ